MIDVALVLIVLHAPDGHEIMINPDQVTSLRAAKPGEEGKHFTEEVKCMVGLTDGKFVTVVETCASVKDKMERAR